MVRKQLQRIGQNLLSQNDPLNLLKEESGSNINLIKEIITYIKAIPSISNDINSQNTMLK
jgi:hypothetical protein